MDTHTTELVLFSRLTDDVDDGVAFGVCFVVFFVQRFNDVLEVFFPCGFAFVLGEVSDGVGKSEKGGRWFVVKCGVPFVWCEAVPVVNDSVCDSVSDVPCLLCFLCSEGWCSSGCGLSMWSS